MRDGDQRAGVRLGSQPIARMHVSGRSGHDTDIMVERTSTRYDTRCLLNATSWTMGLGQLCLSDSTQPRL